MHGPGNADELGHHIGVVHQHQRHHHQEGEPQPELLADQVAQAFAGDHAHPRAHLLHHDQREGDGNHGPQQRVAVLRARLRVGEDAARVVIDVGGNESGAENGQKQQYPDSPTLTHARGFLWGIHLDFLHEHNRVHRDARASAWHRLRPPHNSMLTQLNYLGTFVPK